MNQISISGICSKHNNINCRKCKNIIYVKQNRIKTKEKLVNLFGGKCISCGYNKYVGALEFHHINSSTKNFSISYGNRALEKSYEEALKCVLLCANCHREVGNNIKPCPIPSLPLPLNVQEPVISPKKICPHCCSIKDRNAKHCKICFLKHFNRTKIKWPTLEELIKLVAEFPLTTIGKMLGVSDSAVRKYIRRRKPNFFNKVRSTN